jgi:hypothetical protein
LCWFDEVKAMGRIELNKARSKMMLQQHLLREEMQPLQWMIL